MARRSTPKPTQPRKLNSIGDLPSKTVVMISGGIDSTTLCHYLRPRCAELRGVYADYGQVNAIRARSMISRLSVRLNLPVEHIDVSGMVKSFVGFLPTPFDENLVMTCETHGITMREGPEQEEPQFFAITAVCATYAMSIGHDALATGYNLTDLEEDPGRYRNLKRTHGDIARAMTYEGRSSEFRMPMPFAGLSKHEVLGLAQRLRVPLEQTWSCWAHTPQHCGLCPGCDSRRRAFAANGQRDSTVYMLRN